MKGKISDEFLFPKSYLVESVEERVPYNGKIKGNSQGGLCDKTVCNNDSITQRMIRNTANVMTYHFAFKDNPLVGKVGCKLDFEQLISSYLNDSEVVSNHGDYQSSSIKSKK